MEDEMVNGVVSDDLAVEITQGEDQSENNLKIEGLMQKISTLEQEKRELMEGNESAKDRIKKLEDEIESAKEEMKREIEKSEGDKKALESIAGRAAELEAEVARLQHDLISATTDGQEANSELLELKGVVAQLKKGDAEKGAKFEVLEKERNLLLERMNKDAEKVKESKAESESRINELEKIIESLEVRESNQKSERVKVEEETRVKISEKEDQIRSLKRMVDEFQSVIARNRADMERSNKEKEELEIVKNDLEALLKKSERRVKEMEHKMDLLQKELDASEKMITVLEEKQVDGINGKGVVVDRGLILDEDKKLLGLKLEWPVVAASAGAIAIATATVAVVYLRYGRKY